MSNVTGTIGPVAQLAEAAHAINAIVVVENIYRHLELGKPLFEAAVVGTVTIAAGQSSATFDIDAVDDAIAEVARVLAPGGRFCFFLNHPILQAPGSVWVDDHLVDPPEQYWRIGPYLVESAVVEEVRKDVFIRFLHRPLSRYLNALADHGLLVERLEEPAPASGLRARAEEYDAAAWPTKSYVEKFRAEFEEAVRNGGVK